MPRNRQGVTQDHRPWEFTLHFYTTNGAVAAVVANNKHAALELYERLTKTGLNPSKDAQVLADAIRLGKV